jgi:hypothetical protein
MSPKRKTLAERAYGSARKGPEAGDGALVPPATQAPAPLPLPRSSSGVGGAAEGNCRRRTSAEVAADDARWDDRRGRCAARI